MKHDQLLMLVNQQPPQNWIKTHPMVKVKNEFGQSVPLQYLPVDKVEYLLTMIFRQWRLEILTVQALFQSIAVTVRLHYRNPIDGLWYQQDGVGASMVQTDSGASAADLGKIKSAAVQIAAPAAESYALKDAAEKIGPLFGKDLNKFNTLSFEPFQPEQQEAPYVAPPPVQPEYQQAFTEQRFAQPQPTFQPNGHHNGVPPVQPQFSNFNNIQL